MSTARKKIKPSLGQHLEWRGRKIGVVVRVPPSLHTKFGNKLRKTLDTDSPKLAEVLKYAALQELKAELYRAKHGTKDDPLIRDAFLMRKGLEEAKRLPLPETEWALPHHDTLELVASDLAEEIGEREGGARAEMFIGIAHGVAHPIMLFVEEWIVASKYAPRTSPSKRQSVVKLDTWVKAQTDVAQVLEAITPRVASRYVEEVFEQQGADPVTANKLLSGLSTYWKWLLKTNRLDPDKVRNPWPQLRISKRKDHRSEHKTTPRPFTDGEVATLLGGITQQPMADMMKMSLACGMRLDEIALLRVGRVQGECIEVRIGKTASGSRTFPLPTALAPMLEARSEGKALDAYLFHELKDQRSGARGRGAPITQAFIRARKKLDVDDTPPGATQSRVTFHSCRRWFIRKAVEAYERGATGYTPWTIADVVGHNSAEDGPLKMTMGLYPGKSDMRAMRACLEAVALPSVA